ncbi:antirestriction protein ArdA [Oscillospiraceae bacterium 21-37]
MQFQAILSNPDHPEYGVATIPFPLPMKEYDHSMEVLEALEIGDAVRQDCKVEEITGGYPVLKRLEGQSVNMDELDYLAKRLDSFWGDEGSQFQAMAEKLNLTDITDFINLTFCCQQATVITDFSNLEQIGKDHYMNLNGGCARTEELENLDGEETARLLIDSGAGVVTPYGVVYDNGMELEPLYRGGPFPPYLYDVHPLVLEAIPLSEPEDTKNVTLLCLPMTDRQLEHALSRGKTGDVEQVRFKVDSIFVQDLGCVSNLEQESLTALNEMCRAIAGLEHNELIKLGAAITLAQPQSAMQVKHLAENLELFEFIPEVKTPEEYGRYMIQESGHFEYDDNLEGFYDFAGYAKQRMSREQGRFVENGYISYQGTLSLDELMADSPEQGFQIGGMQ